MVKAHFEYNRFVTVAAALYLGIFLSAFTTGLGTMTHGKLLTLLSAGLALCVILFLSLVDGFGTSVFKSLSKAQFVNFLISYLGFVTMLFIPQYLLNGHLLAFDAITLFSLIGVPVILIMVIFKLSLLKLPLIFTKALVHALKAIFTGATTEEGRRIAAFIIITLIVWGALIISNG